MTIHDEHMFVRAYMVDLLTGYLGEHDTMIASALLGALEFGRVHGWHSRISLMYLVVFFSNLE